MFMPLCWMNSLVLAIFYMANLWNAVKLNYENIYGENCLGTAEILFYVDANVASSSSLSSLTNGHKAASLADSSPASVPLSLRVEPKPKSGIRSLSLSLNTGTHKMCAFWTILHFVVKKKKKKTRHFLVSFLFFYFWGFWNMYFIWIADSNIYWKRSWKSNPNGRELLVHLMGISQLLLQMILL